MNPTADNLAETMTDFVNHYNGRKEGEFIKAFEKQHRTLQQSSFRMMLELIEHMASDEYRTDGRNDASKNIAKSLIQGFKEAKKKQYISEGTSEERAEQYVNGEFGCKPSKWLPFI